MGPLRRVVRRAGRRAIAGAIIAGAVAGKNRTQAQPATPAEPATHAFCINCGEKLKADSKFCPKCGSPVP
ncbi:MAG: zinc-ribbon domain-containing protein [Candidatus Helarchaeota archaeon]|nr:zinc-ribbon domain-containing protein [Candidatus Helarchaeota archaeon]